MAETLFYNEALKEEYLNEKYEQANKETKSHPVVRLFSISKELESHLDKDLHLFTLRELERMFYMSQPSTVTASENFVSQTSSYIDWANKKYKTGKVNPLVGISAQWKRQFGIQMGKSLFTNLEIHKLVQDIPEPQIAVVIILLFNGVQGRDLSELSNLREKDIDFDNKILTVTDCDNNTRKVEVSQLCLDTIKKAIAATEYGTLSYHKSLSKKNKNSKLPEDTDLVIRKGVNAATKDYRLNSILLHKRLEDVQKHYNLSQLTPYNLVRSGILAHAFELYVENNEIFNDELVEKVFDKFKINEYQEKVRALKNYLNEEMLVKTYKIRSNNK